ncbi:MAG: ATP-binding cassette domain-containing protein [Pseudomonadota bacterium]
MTKGCEVELVGEEILVFRNVAKVYDGRRVLDAVSFSVREGEHLSLSGESTSGKTTIMKIIAGLVQPEEGEVLVFGRNIVGLGEREKRDLLRCLGMQFQSGALFDSMTVGENINFVLDEGTNLSRKQKNEVTTALLRGVNLFSAIDKHPFELSGGMKRRVAVVRALASSPRLALFDEPAAGLDPVTTDRIVRLIKKLVEAHRMTIIACSSDVHLARRFSPRLLLLKDGRIHADAPWTELMNSSDEYVRKFLNRAPGY